MEITHKYDDIISLPHHVSDTRPHMPLIDRAAQFSPFAALTGYEDAVTETARLTDSMLELDDTQKEVISNQLRLLQEHIKEQPGVKITYFVPDEKKSGGAYISTAGQIKRIDAYEAIVMFCDGTSVPFSRIYAVESDYFTTHE